MKVRLIKHSKSKALLDSIASNLDRYRAGDFSYLEIDSDLYFETRHDIDEQALAGVSCTAREDREVENCEALFRAMGTLSPYLARDERLWTYLVHTRLLVYARTRWPIPTDDEKAIKHIRAHFFVIGGGRGFERDNAASRLWWMASLCDRAKGLSLNEALTALLCQYDVRANIVERPTTSQSIVVFSAVLKKLNESFSSDKRLFERSRFRSIMRELNLIGGTKLISAMKAAEVNRILDHCIRKAG